MIFVMFQESQQARPSTPTPKIKDMAYFDHASESKFVHVWKPFPPVAWMDLKKGSSYNVSIVSPAKVVTKFPAQSSQHTTGGVVVGAGSKTMREWLYISHVSV